MKNSKISGNHDFENPKDLEEKLEKDNLNLKNHIKMLQDTIKNLKKDNSSVKDNSVIVNDTQNLNTQIKNNSKNINNYSKDFKDYKVVKDSKDIRENNEFMDFNKNSIENSFNNSNCNNVDKLLNKFSKDTVDFNVNKQVSDINKNDIQARVNSYKPNFNYTENKSNLEQVSNNSNQNKYEILNCKASKDSHSNIDDHKNNLKFSFTASPDNDLNNNLTPANTNLKPSSTYKNEQQKYVHNTYNNFNDSNDVPKLSDNNRLDNKLLMEFNENNFNTNPNSKYKNTDDNSNAMLNGYNRSYLNKAYNNNINSKYIDTNDKITQNDNNINLSSINNDPNNHNNHNNILFKPNEQSLNFEYKIQNMNSNNNNKEFADPLKGYLGFSQRSEGEYYNNNQHNLNNFNSSNKQFFDSSNYKIDKVNILHEPVNKISNDFIIKSPLNSVFRNDFHNQLKKNLVLPEKIEKENFYDYKSYQGSHNVDNSKITNNSKEEFNYEYGTNQTNNNISNIGNSSMSFKYQYTKKPEILESKFDEIYKNQITDGDKETYNDGKF